MRALLFMQMALRSVGNAVTRLTQVGAVPLEMQSHQRLAALPYHTVQSSRDGNRQPFTLRLGNRRLMELPVYEWSALSPRRGSRHEGEPRSTAYHGVSGTIRYVFPKRKRLSLPARKLFI